MNKEQRYITSDWFSDFPLGQEAPGTRNWLDNAERKLGGKETAVEYYFNDWRYRGTIEPGYNTNASFGCSHTLGYGVQTPYSEIIRYANIGVSGLSNDAIARLAYAYCENFDPKCIVVMWTIPHRREYINEEGQVVKFRYDRHNENNINRELISLQNDKWDEYNLQKNKLFLINYCISKEIRLLEYDFTGNDKQARDGMHPGPIWHANMAAQILLDIDDDSI